MTNRRLTVAGRVALLIRAGLIAGLVLVPIFWFAPAPEHPDYVRALLYNPPPPPPAPLPKGSALVQKPEPAKPTTPDPTPRKPELEVQIPQEKPLEPEAKVPESEQAGSPTGSDFGLEDGMEGGVEGGQVGGVPGGVLGGVVGGTGDGPVMDYDQPPPWLHEAVDPMDNEGWVHVSPRPGLGLTINFDYIRSHAA